MTMDMGTDMSTDIEMSIHMVTPLTLRMASKKNIPNHAFIPTLVNPQPKM